MSYFDPVNYDGNFAWTNTPMNPLTPEDTDLIESVAEPLGFHQATVDMPYINPRKVVRLMDSWNHHDIQDRLATLTNTLALVGLSVKAHQSAVDTHRFTYSVIKL